MERMWAPWRLDYIVGEKVDGCIFCVFPARNEDETDHILVRGKHAYVIMNAFPYSNCHLLIPPYRHIGDFTELNDAESLEIEQLARLSCNVLKAICRPDGYNIGWNIGTAAGAGIAGHIHMHIVPRWHGDTNFMPVLADIKVIPEALETTYQKLKAEFDRQAG
jgi:ATP adenylyltransferase